MKNLIDSLTVFALMIIGGFIDPFRDSEDTDYSGTTDA